MARVRVRVTGFCHSTEAFLNLGGNSVTESDLSISVSESHVPKKTSSLMHISSCPSATNPNFLREETLSPGFTMSRRKSNVADAWNEYETGSVNPAIKTLNLSYPFWKGNKSTKAGKFYCRREPLFQAIIAVNDPNPNLTLTLTYVRFRKTLNSDSSAACEP